MAKKVVTEDKTLETWLNEKVPFMAFMDANNYNDDIVVIHNGTTYKIKRGEQVMIPRYLYNILMRSAKQNAKTASMINGLEKQAEF